MDQSLERAVDDVLMSDSLNSFALSNTVEDHYSMIRDLEKKVAAEKQAKEMTLSGIEEIRAEIEALQDQRGFTKSQISDATQRIADLREKLQVTKNEKAAAEHAERQRTKFAKQSGMSMDQMIELRDRLTFQRTQINELESRLSSLKEDKVTNQKQSSDQQATLKEQSNTLSALKRELESTGERREYLKETYASLVSNVEAIQEDIQRLRSKLANPVREEPIQGQSLFEEVTAEKKALEQELIGIVEITHALRQQIRQKQEEIDELESHETENLCTVNTEYVLSKMRKLLTEDGGMCNGLKKMEMDVSCGVTQLEQLQVDNVEEQEAKLGKQYLDIRIYQIDCVKNVIQECEKGINSDHFKSFVGFLSNSSS